MKIGMKFILGLSLLISACGSDKATDNGSSSDEKLKADASADQSDGSAGKDAASESSSSPVEACANSGSDKADVPGSECEGVLSCGTELSCEICCMEGAGTAFACGSEKADCAEGFSKNLCDGPEDCKNGEVCCTIPGQPTGCTAAAACEGKLACHTDAECAAQPGTVCTRHRFLTWWGFCQPAPSM